MIDALTQEYSGLTISRLSSLGLRVHICAACAPVSFMCTYAFHVHICAVCAHICVCVVDEENRILDVKTCVCVSLMR